MRFLLILLLLCGTLCGHAKKAYDMKYAQLVKEANKGNVDAMFILGYWHCIGGKDVPIQPGKGKRWLMRADSLGHDRAAACLLNVEVPLGLTDEQRVELSRHVIDRTPNVTERIEAALFLSDCYLQGKCVEMNSEKAINVLESALAKGKGLPPDYKTVEKGLLTLADLLWNRGSARADRYSKAYKYYMEVANGSGNGTHTRGYALLYGGCALMLDNMTGGKSDYAPVRKAFEDLASDSRYPTEYRSQAMINLSILYDGVASDIAPDHDKAVRFLNQAIDLGSAAARYMRASNNYKEQNWADAKVDFEILTNLPDNRGGYKAEAYRSLAKMYRFGRGVPENTEYANELVRLASELGDETADEILNILNRK